MKAELRKRYLAVIPARGGSKRLPGKNLMKIGEDSLIGRAILTAKGISAVAHICVSTDDEAIAQEACKYGPYVPFTRPAQLATDEAKTIDVVLHAIDWYEARGETFDAIILLQPTSPLRSSKHLDEALQLFESHDAEAVASVCKLEHPLEWCATLGEDGSMSQFGASTRSQKRSQDLGQHFRLNGAIYVYKVSSLRAEKAFFYGERTFAYEMDIPSSTDVDTLHDYQLAKFWESLGKSNS
ncbi:acylneuraminate cytidylyltransferase family protein [Metapseudomonas furukawaii]|uniref:acylneuraminate cytidylyltransferase family protein n=1 Tax=Metapseudomonas furukawaii TaxID=1149133 RepID=UPI0040460153